MARKTRGQGRKRVTVAENTAGERWSNGDANGSGKGRRGRVGVEARSANGRGGARRGPARREWGEARHGGRRGGGSRAALRTRRWGWADGRRWERARERRRRRRGADIDEERKAVCVCNERALLPFDSTIHLFFSLACICSRLWKVRGEGWRAKEEEDRKGRSPLAWNLTLHRWVLSAACSRDTATISGVVNSRILNGTLTDAHRTGDRI